MLTGKNNDGHSFDLPHMLKLSHSLALISPHTDKGRESAVESDCVVLSRRIGCFLLLLDDGNHQFRCHQKTFPEGKARGVLGGAKPPSLLVCSTLRSPFYFVPVCLSRDDSKLPWLYITQYAELSSRLPSLLLSISSNKRPSTQWGQVCHFYCPTMLLSSNLQRQDDNYMQLEL